MRKEHQDKLLYGVKHWNQWRNGHHWFASIDLSQAILRTDIPGIDLRDANLAGADFRGISLNNADLRDACLEGANFEGACLVGCDLRGALLDGANFKKADLEGARLELPDLLDTTLKRADRYSSPRTKNTSLRKANFAGANLQSITAEKILAEMSNFAGANFRNADLTSANFRGANLNGANCVESNLQGAILDHATLVKTDLSRANISNCSVYGISAWDIVVVDANQDNLAITPRGSDPIVTDNIELAQFMYLLLNNKKVRSVIDTISTKLVLILGRFTEERMSILNELRTYIRSIGCIPVLCDFEKPGNRDLTETIVTLAHLSRAVIADLTEARAVAHELSATIPHLPSVRFQPICATSDIEYAMFEHFRNYQWVLPTLYYDSLPQLKAQLADSGLFVQSHAESTTS